MTNFAEKASSCAPCNPPQHQDAQGVAQDRKALYEASSVERYNALLKGDKRPEGLLGLVWDKRVRERSKAPDRKAPELSPAQKTTSTSTPERKRLDPGVAPIVTKRWRDLPPESLLSFYAQAVRELGDPVLFSLHFTKDVHEKMRKAKEKPRDFIAKRMRRHLKGVAFYFVIELTANQILHIHGALAQTSQSDELIRTGLRKVCGRKTKALSANELFFINCKASHTNSPDWKQNFRQCVGDFGWAQYCGKDMQKTLKHLHMSGKLIACSRTVTQQAKEGHRIDCDL